MRGMLVVNCLTNALEIDIKRPLICCCCFIFLFYVIEHFLVSDEARFGHTFEYFPLIPLVCFVLFFFSILLIVAHQHQHFWFCFSFRIHKKETIEFSWYSHGIFCPHLRKVLLCIETETTRLIPLYYKFQLVRSICLYVSIHIYSHT